MRFLFSAPLLELCKFKDCKLHCRLGACSQHEKIQREKGVLVVSEPESKDYNVVFRKRRLMDNFDSLPYAFEQFILFIYFIYLLGFSEINRSVKHILAHSGV